MNSLTLAALRRRRGLGFPIRKDGRRRGVVWHWLAQPSTIKPLHHPQTMITSPTVLRVLAPCLRPSPPPLPQPPHREVPRGSHGIPKPEAPGGGSPGRILPVLCPPPSLTPTGGGGCPPVPGPTPTVFWPRTPRSGGIHSPPAPAGNPGRAPLPAALLRDLRVSVSASASAGTSVRGARRARRARLWLGACRVSVA